MNRMKDIQENKERVVFHLNIREKRKDLNCCGGNGPNCKCSSNKNKKNSMVDFFKSMSKNFLDK